MMDYRNPTIGNGYIEIQAVKKNRKKTEQNLTFYKADVVSRKHNYPFHFHAPEHANSSFCRWIYTMSFGGGLVGGDTVNATVKVGPDCCALVTTQESTKIYHCKYSGQTIQNLHYSIGDNGLLCILPDATICYKDADFKQSQVIHMTTSSNLVILDWMLSGRKALNEFWAFKRFKNCLEVYVSDELVIKDCSELEDTPYQTVSQGMQHYHVYGTCIVLGNGMNFLVENLVKLYAKKKDFETLHDHQLIVSITETRYVIKDVSIFGCYLRFLASDMNNAARVIKEINAPLLGILGADPYERKL